MMLREEIKDHLQNVLIPFWKSMRDNENGGYYGLLDFDLKVDKKAVKGCILNSRILWFFSNAYLMLGEASLLLEADHAYEFLEQYCMDKTYGGVYWSLKYNGEVEDSMKHTYNQAFAIYALSSYYDASRKETALWQAAKLYDLIESICCDGKGYLEAFSEDFKLVGNEKLSENGVMAEKTMNTLLHVFEAYTEFYRVLLKEEKQQNQEGNRVLSSKQKEGLKKSVGEKLRWILDLFIEKIYNPKKERQEVFFDCDWHSLIDLHSYGHDIETAWLIDRGCEILGDPIYTEKCSKMTTVLTKKIYERAYQNHSVLNECENGIDNKNRIWWIQAEAMVGFLNGYEKQPEKIEYYQAVEDIWNYIKEYLMDKRKGSEWFWEVDEKNIPFNKKPLVEPWKCPYHNGRMCFEMIRRLRNAS